MDIRDKQYLKHEDIVSLNFISSDSGYIFRRHYNQGLRSHIMQVLRQEDYIRETKGKVIDGRMDYSIAKPSFVLRIFKSRLTKEQAFHEVEKINVIRKYMLDNMAYSQEFIASYKKNGDDIILCGLQEFIDGSIVDPWFCVPDSYDENFRQQMNKFIERIKQTIHNTSYLPDLAGIGNLIYSSNGVMLTDMNNINKLNYSDDIFLDDKGFPIIDTSIEALSNLEIAVNGSANDKLYHHFFDAKRRQKVVEIKRNWKKAVKPYLGAH